MPVYRTAGLLCLMLAAFDIACAQDAATTVQPASDCSQAQRSRLEDQARFAGFLIRSYRGVNAGGCLQISKDDTVVFSRSTGGRFLLRNGFGEAETSPIPVGTDITGLGIPNLILSEWTGGAHCCFVFRVLELGERVTEIASVDVRDAGDSYFADLDHDGIYELLARDYTFAYWHTSFAESPAPRIVLRFNCKGYELAPDLMKSPPLSAPEIDRIVAEIRNSDPPPPLLWKTILDLIYTGNADLAWTVLRVSWPSKTASAQEFLRGFCAQLATSPYFAKLRPTLSNAPCAFDPKNTKP